MVGKRGDEVVEVFSQGVLVFGGKARALTRSQALEALERLKLLNVPVSGGDVLHLAEGRFVPEYDNWYFEDLDGPNSVEQSIQYARDYITGYNYFPNPFFVLVPHLKD